MKSPIAIILFLLFSTIGYAQKVKFKDDKISVDGVEILSYKKTSMMDEYYFYKLNTTDEVMYISYDRNGTRDYDGDNFSKLFFAKQNIKVETKALWFGLNSKPIIEKLLQEGVLQLDGVINEEKLKVFYNKYNEQLTK